MPGSLGSKPKRIQAARISTMSTSRRSACGSTLPTTSWRKAWSATHVSPPEWQSLPSEHRSPRLLQKRRYPLRRRTAGGRAESFGAAPRAEQYQRDREHQQARLARVGGLTSAASVVVGRLVTAAGDAVAREAIDASTREASRGIGARRIRGATGGPECALVEVSTRRRGAGVVGTAVVGRAAAAAVIDRALVDISAGRWSDEVVGAGVVGRAADTDCVDRELLDLGARRW